MQAGSNEPVAGTSRKAGSRRWGVKGRVEKRVSTETEMRTRVGALIRRRLTPEAGSKDRTSHRSRCHVPAVHAGRGTRWTPGHLEPFSFPAAVKPLVSEIAFRPNRHCPAALRPRESYDAT